MASVKALVTSVDLGDGEAAARQVSVSARHEAELSDGRRVLLLNDRGWGSSGDWAGASIEDIQETACVVVGPDEPFDGQTHEDAEADHWACLQDILQREGLVVDAAELRQLPHDVQISQRLLARIAATGKPRIRHHAEPVTSSDSSASESGP